MFQDPMQTGFRAAWDADQAERTVGQGDVAALQLRAAELRRQIATLQAGRVALPRFAQQQRAAYTRKINRLSAQLAAHERKIRRLLFGAAPHPGKGRVMKGRYRR